MYVIRCRDVGFDCPGVVRAETRDALMQQVAGHARDAHGLEVTPELAAKVAGLVRVEGGAPEAGAPR
jgi:predicted small metal-binding protein